MENYEGKYDGQSHGLTVKGDPANTDVLTETLQYSTDGSDWSDKPVTKKDVNTGAEGKYTVYTRVQTVVTGGKTYTSQQEDTLYQYPAAGSNCYSARCDQDV